MKALEPKTTLSTTATVSMDEAYERVSQAWDTMFLPTPPEGFEGDVSEETQVYVQALLDIIKSMVEKSNTHEAAEQRLAEANIRQHKIILKLREELQDLKTRDLPKMPQHNPEEY